MSIEKNWQNWDKQADADLSDLLQPGQLEKLHSSSPLKKIKFYLLVSMIWSVLIAAIYVYMMIQFPQWPVLLCIGVVLLFTLWAGYSSWQQYKSIDPYAGVGSLLSQMQKHYDGIHIWMKNQMKVAVFVYPVACTGGFMIGGMMGSGKSIAFFLSKPPVIAALLISIAVLVPVCIWFSKWMFKKSFGKHLDTLKKNIDALKAG
jgi:hypothetical protein